MHVQDDANTLSPSKSDISVDYVKGEVFEFKKRVDAMLSANGFVPFQIEDALNCLKEAEAELDSSASEAWFKLAQAKIALHDGTFISNREIVNGDMTVLRKEVYKVWHELNSIQRTHRHVNTTNAADWLIWAEQALDSTPIDKPQAMYCVMRARYSLAKAQEFAEWDRYGYFAIAIESLYLIGIPIVTVLYSNQSGIATSELMTRPIFQVPLFVFVWGFLGGVSWSIYSAAYWSKRRLFDRHYLSWYLAHPWISAVLGGAVALIVLGGLASFGSFDANTQPGSAILALVSFVSGFSTNSIWKLIDRTVRRILDVKGSNRNVHEEAHEETLQGHKAA